MIHRSLLSLFAIAAAGLSTSLPAADSPTEGPLQPFLGDPEMELRKIFSDERFPNIVASMDGTLVATWGSDTIRVRRSSDGGRSWGPEIPIGSGMHGGGALVNETDGELFIFFHPDHPPRDGTTAPRRVFVSSDNGLNWKERTDVVFREDQNGFIPALHMSERGITLRHGGHAGRLIRPARVYQEEGGERKGYNTAIYSDDGGTTWIPSSPFPEEGTGEGALVELSDGRLYYNSRVHWEKRPQNTRRRAAWSEDDGESWKDWQLVEVLPDGRQDRSYGCMAGLVRLPVKGRDILLFSNLDTPNPVRERITVWASFDGGNTWPVKRLVFDGPSRYSSLTAGRPGMPGEGWIYLLFEEGDGGAQVARFNLPWVLQGQPTGDGIVPENLE